MAAKRVDPLKAKEAKQKKIAAVGAVLLLALVAVQGPKTLKMLKGPQAVASATSTTPTTTPPPLGTQAPTDDGTSTPAPTAELASVQDSDAPPEAAEGQLATFERFASKDPFVQQAEAAPDPAASDDDAVASGADAEEAAGAGAEPDADSGAGDDDAAGGFTPGGVDQTPPQQPAEPALAATTSIAVNGVAEDVAVEAAFPKDEPTFVLVSVAKDGKSVQIGIAGGAYATGGETMKLGLGQKLTLQNTADGSRYELELRTIQGFPIPKKQKKG
jgi:hypothetical protein